MKFSKILFLILILFFVTSCIKPIEISNISYENFLVVEATITNELKTQTIQLSRTFQLEETEPTYETNAIVTVKDNNNTYLFTETSNGIYESTIPFKAEIDKEYILEISTNDGKNYFSSSEKLNGINPIDDLKVEKSINNIGEEGIHIIVKSNTTDINAKYYRYVYEETYKIIAPKWSTSKLDIVSDVFPFEVQKITNTDNNRFCYKTLKSKVITQTETASLSHNNVDFPIRFIDKFDFMIAHRYSILVKQYVQSFEAYTFYKTLNKISSSQGSFTSNQPGFISGNIQSTTDPKDKVIGFFELASVSEKRIFFNRVDFFPNTSVTYVDQCMYAAPLLVDGMGSDLWSPLIETLQHGKYIYYTNNSVSSFTLPGPYLLVPKVCGDCREIGTNTKPSFWVD